GGNVGGRTCIISPFGAGHGEAINLWSPQTQSKVGRPAASRVVDRLFHSGSFQGVTKMRIGIPREIKTLEGRVALVPAACGDLVQAGHEVFIEAGAGEKSGFSDADFQQVGVEVLPDAKALYDRATLIVKVK